MRFKNPRCCHTELSWRKTVNKTVGLEVDERVVTIQERT